MPRQRNWDDDWDEARGKRAARRGVSGARQDKRQQDGRRPRPERQPAQLSAPAPSRTPGGGQGPAQTHDDAPWRWRSLLATNTTDEPTCGQCRNWQQHDEATEGRGECDHPGSGFAFPLYDTAACPFFELDRKRFRRERW